MLESTSQVGLQVYELDKGITQDGESTDVEMIAETKVYDFGFPHEEKTLDWLEMSYEQVTGTTGQFTVEARKDFGDWERVVTVHYTSGKEIQDVKESLRSLGRGRRFQFRIKSSDSNTKPRILSFIVRMRGHVAEARAS